MDFHTFVVGFWEILRANFVQIFIGVLTVGSAILASRLTRKTAKEDNTIKKDRLEFEKHEKNRDRENHDKKTELDHELAESRLLYERQEKLYESTHRLISTLEKRLEDQAKEAHEERVFFKAEITGLRKNVARLERRVIQLITAFRKLGHEPPQEESNEEADAAIEREEAQRQFKNDR